MTTLNAMSVLYVKDLTLGKVMQLETGAYCVDLTITTESGTTRVSLFAQTREQLDRLKIDTVSAVLDEQFAQAAGRA